MVAGVEEEALMVVFVPQVGLAEDGVVIGIAGPAVGADAEGLVSPAILPIRPSWPI